MVPRARGQCVAAMAMILLALMNSFGFAGAIAHGGHPLIPLRGGSAAAMSATTDLKSTAKHRGTQATKAGKVKGSGFFKTLGHIFFGITNKLAITGSSTRVVNGRIVISRNPIQKLLHGIYLFIRAIFLFFKTLFVPATTIQKPSSNNFDGSKRSSFSSLSKKGGGITRMADLPPMPGG
jgi:hypothetical protein